MSEGSISYAAAFSLEYDPGIFFVPGAGEKLAQPNVDSIFTFSGALEQATSLLDQAKAAVSTVSGGAFEFDASSVTDFAVNSAVATAQKALKSTVPSEISGAASYLSQFNPQQLASITSFNSAASLIGSPQEMISKVASQGAQSLGSLYSTASSALSSVVGDSASGVAGSIASKAVASLAGSLGPQAAKFAGGTLPDAATWSTVFGPGFNPSLAPFLNLSLGQVIPPLNQTIEVEVGGTLYGIEVIVPGAEVPVLGEIIS